jgi:acetyl-CoA carboxylase, biotin carboxylase subunit
MNTRIQVEHPVTEMITGIDLVQEQLRVARGEVLRFAQADVSFRGHAIECRINAEHVNEGFRPSPGLITEWEQPAGPNIRLDSHCYAGYKVPIFYDSMIGKLIVYGVDRSEARERMSRALELFKVSGVATTIRLQHFLINQPRFASGDVNTRLVEEVLPQLTAA